MPGPFLNALSADAQAELVALIRAEVAAGLQGVPASSDDPVWLSVQEAAARLGVSEGSLRQAIRRGTLPAHRFERRLILRVEDVDNLPTRGR